MITIIGGKYKRKKINVPLEEVRPTSSLKREAIFAILESYAFKNSFNLYKNKCFIDLYAGSGSFGLEAISRGASFAYFYEINSNVSKILNKNCKLICNKNEYKIFQKDIMNVDSFKIEYPLSSIFIDPPYDLKVTDQLLNKIINSNILTNKSIVVVETEKNYLFKIPNSLNVINEKKYGKTKITFLQKLR